MKLLVGIDFSENATNALNYAAELAMISKGELLVVHVFQSMKPTGKMGLNTKIREDYEKEMARSITNLKSKYPKLKSVKSSIIKGEAHKKLEIIHQREKADLLVIGAKGEKKDPAVFLGNIAGKVVNLANIPMLIIPSNVKFSSPKEIGFAIKRTKVESGKTLQPLKKIMQLFNPRLTVIQVKEDIKKLVIEDHLSKLANNLITIETQKFYKPIEEYVSYSDIDFLCVIRRKRGFFHKFLLSKSFSKAKFNVNLPMLVLQGKKE